jgi:uncharacterized protein YjgD (DUF1641 family)
MKARTGKTYTQYQLDKILDQMQDDYERQWNDKVAEIEDKVFEQVKLDMFSQFMSIAMATLEKFHEFTEEQTKDFYENYIDLMNMMQAQPLGKDFTTQNLIDHVKEETGIDLDKTVSES